MLLTVTYWKKNKENEKHKFMYTKSSLASIETQIEEASDNMYIFIWVVSCESSGNKLSPCKDDFLPPNMFRP